MPPRALWVPFELGRPLGTPADKDFQRSVLLSVLGLLEADTGPVLTDFQEDAPDAADLEGWACPVSFAPPTDVDEDASDLEKALISEIRGLAPWHNLAVERLGRSTVGLSGLDVDLAVRFVAGFLDVGSPPASYRAGLTPGQALKYVCDDLLAYYFESISAQPGRGSSRQIADWFWGETRLGQAFLALRSVCADSNDPVMASMGQFALVPRSQAHRLSSGPG